MPDFTTYKIADFLKEKSFIEWAEKSNPESVKFWENWLLMHPDRRDDLEAARLMHQGIFFAKKSVPKIVVEQNWQGLEEVISPKKRKIFPRWLLVASVSCLLLSIGFFYMESQFSQDQVSYSHKAGKPAEILLPDGTQVFLRNDSRLNYSRLGLLNPIRSVQLDGEAYFHVKKNTLPFLVRTAQLNAQVLGTEFYIKNREGHSEVVLHEGKLAVSKPKQEETESLILSPGEKAFLSSQTLALQKESVNTLAYISWKDNIWMFNDTPMDEIQEMISAYYEIQVELKGEELAKRKLTGELEIGELDELLDVITAIFSIQWKMENDRVVFYE